MKAICVNMSYLLMIMCICKYVIYITLINIRVLQRVPKSLVNAFKILPPFSPRSNYGIRHLFDNHPPPLPPIHHPPPSIPPPPASEPPGPATRCHCGRRVSVLNIGNKPPSITHLTFRKATTSTQYHSLSWAILQHDPLSFFVPCYFE